mgnify:CR=1 FL=1
MRQAHRLEEQHRSVVADGRREQGLRVAGYGAPGKGNTLLNYCSIGTDFLEFTVDRNPYKHGRFTPGTHIPVYPVEAGRFYLTLVQA